MSLFADLRCPACGGELAERATSVDCAACARAFEVEGRLADLRVDRAAERAPEPLGQGAFERAIAASARGVPFKPALEELLLSLDEVPADRLMQLLGEGRGAWLLELASEGGELLFVGNALSGAITPLADAGFRVTVLDDVLERARFARVRDDAHSAGRTRTVLARGARLPFADARFDVVVHEDGLPGPRGRRAHAIAEASRVARAELLVIGDNRLGYKRSTGRRSILYVPSPLAYAREAIAPKANERSLAGYRSALAMPGWSRARAFALYPHRNDFTHVVALDAPRPALTIGPMEQKNRVKLAARAVGLFPVFTPSFALFASRGATPASHARLDAILDELARVTGEPRPEVEQIVATRGNSAVVHTRPADDGDGVEQGRWTLHVPLAPKNGPQTARHVASLRAVRERFPDVPVPEPLHFGRVAGVLLGCERRLPGWTAPQRAGDHPRIARMLADASKHFAKLLVKDPAPFTNDDYEREIGARIDLVRRHAAVASTIENLDALRTSMRARLVGRKIARVYYHADLRAKHVQIDLDDRVLGYLDWGTSEDEAVPYFDLLHLVVHERKQEADLKTGAAWRIVRERDGLREHERAALESYRAAVGLDDDTARAFEELYPVFVAAMAEAHWDYSRPRWLHRQFGL